MCPLEHISISSFGNFSLKEIKQQQKGEKVFSFLVFFCCCFSCHYCFDRVFYELKDEEAKNKKENQEEILRKKIKQ